MPRFFITAAQRTGDRIRIDGADGAHLVRTLRVRVGERIATVDEQQLEHMVAVESVSHAGVEGRIVGTRAAQGEPRLLVHVLQAVPAHGMDACVEALVVAGAGSVRPVLTARGVRRPDAQRAHGRVQRWRTTAREAAQLAGRGMVPPVHEVVPLDQAVTALPAGCPILACVLSADAAPLASYRLDSPGPAALVIGPEGGLDAAEMTMLRAHGAALVHLGERVAPSRLAGVLALTLLLAASGDLDSAVVPANGEQ
ncbi:MAG: 16S rRNA (uracil(1498)-N(3))-methyltransferase [Candidatus Dormibacteraeota bacterium]|nr:16S rRNA (uracil(1498)-N(3))-methyltransferase [Candidatus Dormibacteraeota bacterium]